MAAPRLLKCTRHPGAALHVCSYSTLGRPTRPLEKADVGPVFQYVGKHKKPNHKVFVWGFSFTGALGIPSFVVPDSGRKKPRKYQLSPYRLDTAEQVRLLFPVFIGVAVASSVSNKMFEISVITEPLKCTFLCGFCLW